MGSHDAVLVPGGGVQANGTPPPWVRTHLDRAAAERGGGWIITLSAGTVHKPPPLDADGFPLAESACGARYLLNQGVPADRILFETASYDTIGNAYFARTIHTDPARLHRLLVVTSEFHLPRTREIFTWVFGLSTDAYQLTFQAVPDVGLDPDALAARQRRERESLADLRPLTRRITTLSELHQRLFTEHSAYAPTPRRTELGAELGTY